MKKIITISLLFAVLFTTSGFAQQPAAKTEDGKKQIIITNFSAYEKDSKLVIDWATDGRAVTNYWQVQRSSGEGEFSTIAFVLGNDPKQSGDRYQYVEKLKDSKTPNARYRLCYVSRDGSEQFSNIIELAKQ